jgi:hypothetical protein
MDMKPFYDLMKGMSQEEKGSAIGKLIADGVNQTGAKEFTDAMNREIRSEHRYLQSIMYQSMFDLIKWVARDYDNKAYDARNSTSVRLCKAISSTFFEGNNLAGLLPPDEVGH